MLIFNFVLIKIKLNHSTQKIRSQFYFFLKFTNVEYDQLQLKTNGYG